MKDCVVCSQKDDTQPNWVLPVFDDNSKGIPFQVPMCIEFRKLPRPRVSGYKKIVITW